MTKTRFVIGAILMMHVQLCLAEHVRLITQDEVGFRVPNILVVVSLLRPEKYLQLRFLTDSKGETPSIDLPSGLYQFVATCPFGLWRGSVTELFVGDNPKDIVLPVKAKSEIDVVDVSKRTAVTLRIGTALSEGPPLSNVEVMSRDVDGGNEIWLRTDTKGQIRIHVNDVNDGGPTILVVPIDGQIFRFVLASDCKTLSEFVSNRNLLPRDTPCVPVIGSSLEITVLLDRLPNSAN